MRFSPIQRLLRRVPALRQLVLIHARDIRHKRQEAAWEETQAVLTAIGNITIGWAGINLILNTFFDNYTNKGGAKARKEIPRAFTEKLKYLKEIEKDPLCASIYLTEARDVRLKLAEMNEFRVALFHGLAMRRGYGTSWTIHMAREEKNQLRRWNQHHTSSDIFAFSKDVSDWGGRLARLYPLPEARR